MIRVNIKRRPDNRRIERFRVEGHAEYDKSGKDIVCAGVSAVTVGTVNAVEALLGVELVHRMKNGLLQVDVPAKLDPRIEEQVQLLLESMVVMLSTIEQSYGAYIAMQES
ncbi:ribosomal-processing cysteine protease Prp [Paenibacillus thalictri]|uniref:Ribosomal processing cysteine protease Prp n=1 Tax=Paenibacillus thalictri TaxID=2527873 RepID=A0A4V2J4X8_9BACL|nr:ribosomal-processing cysteine protease Prp [Paenibacillus thalictri]TBL81622.1 ribosomal-processing cysteine protease Prp [Paenibacillus thalictri]